MPSSRSPATSSPRSRSTPARPARRSSSTPGSSPTAHDSYDLRARLAQLAGEEGNTAEVEKQLCAAKKLDPERSYPYQALSALYKKAGDTPKALAELEHYAFIEQMELAPLKELVVEYARLSNWPKVRTYGEMATFLNPQDSDILMNLGHAYLELGDGAKSLYSYDTILVANPPPRRPALVHLGRARALVALGKKADAKAADRARDEDRAGERRHPCAQGAAEVVRRRYAVTNTNASARFKSGAPMRPHVESVRDGEAAR